MLEHTKIGKILSNHSQDIDQKRNFDVNQGPQLCQKHERIQRGWGGGGAGGQDPPLELSDYEFLPC